MVSQNQPKTKDTVGAAAEKMQAPDLFFASATDSIPAN